MQQTQQINERPRRSQSRRRGEKKVELARSSSTRLVVYNPAQSSHQNNPPNRHRQRLSDGPRREGVLKIRNADVRSTYKVLPIVIGTGSFGTVRSCIHRESRTKLAMKSIAIRGKAANSMLLKNEVALLQRVNHRNVVKVVDVIQDREYIHIIMEQCRGGDLFDKIVDGGSGLSEDRIRKIVASLLDAVAYLHERNIVHRDLKAEHLMFSSNDINSPIKIIDFGVATVHTPGAAPLTAFAGSVRSVAPEVVKRSYGKECDIWSCGVITYFLLMRRMPFDAPSSDPNDVFRKIVTGRFGYPQWAATGLSEEAKDFIDRLLVVDPKERLTAKQALSHPWICNKKANSHSRPRTKPLTSCPAVPSKLRRRQRY